MCTFWIRTLAAVTLGAAVAISAHAQDYPNKPVKLIVPYPAGGTTDIIARITADRLSQHFKQPFVVDNRPGASGAIGAMAVKQAAPDGYTLVMATASSHGINSALNDKLPYDAVKDFAAITKVAMTPNVIAVHPSLPANNLQELLALARDKPGEINFGSTSAGGSPHMSGELLKMMADVDLLHVPYRGAGPMLTDLVGGQIMVGFDNLPSTMPFIRSDKVRALAVTTKERWPGAPDIPTVAESGVPDYEVTGWFGLLAPAQTPDKILNELQEAVVAMLESEEVKQQLLELGALGAANTPAVFAQEIASDVARWQKVVQTTGVTLD